VKEAEEEEEASTVCVSVLLLVGGLQIQLQSAGRKWQRLNSGQLDGNRIQFERRAQKWGKVAPEWPSGDSLLQWRAEAKGPQLRASFPPAKG